VLPRLHGSHAFWRLLASVKSTCRRSMVRLANASQSISRLNPRRLMQNSLMPPRRLRNPNSNHISDGTEEAASSDFHTLRDDPELETAGHVDHGGHNGRIVASGFADLRDERLIDLRASTGNFSNIAQGLNIRFEVVVATFRLAP